MGAQACRKLAALVRASTGILQAASFKTLSRYHHVTSDDFSAQVERLYFVAFPRVVKPLPFHPVRR